MALTVCKECRQTVSTEAHACPHCGAPRKPRADGVATFLWVLLTSAVAAFVITTFRPGDGHHRGLGARPSREEILVQMMAVYRDDDAINPAVFSKAQAELIARRMIALRIPDATARFRSFAVAGCAIPDFRDYLRFIDPDAPDRERMRGEGALQFVERLYANGDKANGDLAVSLTKAIDE